MASRTKGSSSMTNTVDVSAGFIHALTFCRSGRRTLPLCVTLARFHGDDNYAYGDQKPKSDECRYRCRGSPAPEAQDCVPNVSCECHWLRIVLLRLSSMQERIR